MADALVVGAGPAGLAAAYELKRAGVVPRVLDAADEIGSNWRARHEQLHLNTYRGLSHQPGMRIPASAGVFPSRDDYVAYLERYVKFLDLSIEYGTRVQRVEPDDNETWRVVTASGEIKSRHVVVATGSDRVPRMPDWPGHDDFQSELIHAGEFRHARHYAGKRVLLVGAGNSGMDIGNHLANVDIGPSWVSIRNGPNIAPQYVLGLPAQLIVASLRWLPVRLQDMIVAAVSRLVLGDLTKLGIPPAPKGAVRRQREDGTTLAVDNGFVAALRAGKFEVVPEIRSFSRNAVHLTDGRSLYPDAVICATGYRLGLEELVGHLKVLDDRGWPRWMADRGSPELPGLWFLGHNSSLYGNMNIRRGEARRLARVISLTVQRAKRRRSDVLCQPDEVAGI